MYYYIFGPPKSYAENKICEQIKNTLALLGISGETTTVSPARSATELALMGIGKGYSTIVAVGNDELVNEIASNICGSGAVLGIIPVNASNDICDLIGARDIKEACLALQKRHLEIVSMGYLEPGIHFLTKLTIDAGKQLNIQAEIDDFYFETKANRIIINNNLDINIYSHIESDGFLNKFLNFLKEKKTVSANDSFFKARRLRLRTHEIMPVKIRSLTVAKTPIVAYRKPNALKIIKFFSKIDSK